MQATSCGTRALVSSEWNVAAEAGEIALLRHAVCRFAERAGYPDERLADVSLAVSEAATNAIVHAYRGRPQGRLAVTTSVAADGRLKVVVADDGCGFSPRHDSPGLGLGMALIGALCEALEIRPGAGGGTELHMTFAG